MHVLYQLLPINKMSQCQFLFIMSVHCRNGPKTKVLKKIPKNYRNSISAEDSGSQKDKSRGGPQPPHAPWARLGLGRRPGVVSLPRAPSRDALSPTYSPRRENPKCLDDFSTPIKTTVGDDGVSAIFHPG